MILKTAMLWVAVVLSVVGIVLISRGLYLWVRQVYWFITDKDDLCEYPEISDDME